MKRALICLEQLNIGGVETFTLTQISAFTRKKIKCFVLARDGLLREKLKQNKLVEFIEFDFVLKNEVDFEKVKEVENIIKKNKIDFIYVHQFPCILYILPCALKLKVPYVAYLHNVVEGTLDWYMKHYSVYASLFPFYFKNASKIIAIAEKVKQEHQLLFHLPDSKYLIVKNSLDFDDFKDTPVKLPKKYQKLLLFGRVSEEKRTSIEAAISFYFTFHRTYNLDATLTIAGDGNILEEMKTYYEGHGIKFIGAVKDMPKEIEKADILLGVDRCALEAIASKKPTIICGYNGNISLVTPQNIKTCVEENFGGYSLKDDKKELFRYNKEEMKDIIEKNYQYVKKELSINKNIYLDIETMQFTPDLDDFLKDINRVGKQIDRLEELNWILKEENEFLKKEIEKSIGRKAIDRTLKIFKNIISPKEGDKK